MQPELPASPEAMAAVTMVMPALGRPFRLGMLYESRKDQLIPGVTLWDYETLQKDTKATPQPSSVFAITTSDSMDEKSSKLQVDASLKASFMGGLIQVDGSANYLNDKKKSNDQTRVTLQYKATTKFQELSMTQLGKDNMQYPDVFHKDIATHVVTGIQYGAQVFFVFDSEKSETSNVKDLQGSMKAVIRKIPMLDIEGEASLKMTDEEKAISKTMSCKFHGDFNLKANPTSFEEAVKVYHDLPKLLGEDGENVVPQKVWLMPLTCLDSEAAQLIHEISLGLVEQMQDTLEDFSQLEMRCNDALRKVQHFPLIVGQLKDFRAKCLQSMIILKQHMVTNLPLIRGGKKDENVLKTVLEERQDSPFSTKMLSKWMDGKEREINVIRAFVDMMEGTKMASNQNELDREVLNPKVRQVVCFAFTSLDTTDAFLTALSDHLTSTQPGRAQVVKPRMADEELVQQTKQWYYSDDVHSMMREKANRFIRFAKANKSKEHVFLIAAIANPKHQGASIYQYRDGIQITDDFNPSGNLLKNPSGDEQLEFWAAVGWSVLDAAPDHGLPKDDVTTCFYNGGEKDKYQTIDLLAAGFSAEELDAQPAINVEDWYCGSTYTLLVSLLNADPGDVHHNPGLVIQHHMVKEGPAASGSAWRQVKYTLYNYGRGLRRINYEQGSRHGGDLYVTASSLTIDSAQPL